MADDVIPFLDEAGEAIDIRSDSFETSDFPQTLVTEKIIFVVDILLVTNGDVGRIHTVTGWLKSYFHLKKKICVKPPEFECILYNNKGIKHFVTNNLKDLKSAFLSVKDFGSDEDKEPLKMDAVFDKIANVVKLPDPDCAKKCLPPNWVYHVVWLFGRNVHIPTMQNTNSFDFLMMTPYFALDMLYLYNQNIQPNQCDLIQQALSGLNENGKGYLLWASESDEAEVNSCLPKFLGHPLIRVPQIMARFNILELSHNLEAVKNNNDKE